jgi:hypothetical protein
MIVAHESDVLRPPPRVQRDEVGRASKRLVVQGLQRHASSRYLEKVIDRPIGTIVPPSRAGQASRQKVLCFFLSRKKNRIF